MTILTNLDGLIAPTASVSVLDRGFLYGDSVYEVVRTYKGQLFGLDPHLRRLRASADYLYLEIPWSDRHIRHEVERTLAQADWPESYVRIVVTRGTESKISLQPSPALEPSLLIILSAIDPTPTLSQTGVNLVIPDRLRNDQRALSPKAKTGNYLNNILALLEAQQQGADDALLLNGAGLITEATTSNLWVIRDGRVITPDDDVGILQGITRDYIFQILEQHHIPHQKAHLRPSDLEGIEEAFLSSSVRLIMPIRSIDQRPLPHCPGPMTQKIWDEFLTLMDPT
ncbi:aminotransferase class IV [Lyngbya confervoides]|uniref:Aminotransferase class IV n=1 Tax=Lyngbya confervoides BDU141951 TaxID=1574623 RepID=A0ABD4SZZ7_9CYAN|nr:aminotransferase class IV [Lyngbya confervoides]MCM1981954.1 aminotransferase class IV [Lyngbya confervoides BDU141951]